MTEQSCTNTAPLRLNERAVFCLQVSASAIWQGTVSHMAVVHADNSTPTVDAAVIAQRNGALDALETQYPDTEFTVYGLGTSRTYLVWSDGASAAQALEKIQQAWPVDAQGNPTLILRRRISVLALTVTLVRMFKAGADLENSRVDHNRISLSEVDEKEIRVAELLIAHAGLNRTGNIDDRRCETLLAQTVTQYTQALEATFTE